MRIARWESKAGRAASLALVGLAVIGLFAVSAGGLVGAGGSAGSVAAADDDEKKEGEHKRGRYKMVADLHVLMEHVDDLFYGIEDLVEEKKFKKARGSALVVAEILNVSRHSEEFAKEKAWDSLCVKGTADLLEMSKAAKKKDAEAVTKLFKSAEATCDACHEKFRD